MAIDLEASRRWHNRIREILNTDWDPIGGCPEDEYDKYVGRIAAMLRVRMRHSRRATRLIRTDLDDARYR